MKRLLDGSGASTKIHAVYSAMKTAIKIKGYTPDVISGVSASALLGIPVAMGKWNTLDKALRDFDLDTIFSKKPVNEKGKITPRAIKNVVLGRPYLGEMGNLEKMYRRIITAYDFEIYRNGDYPSVWISSIDLKTGRRNIKNLKTLEYEDMIMNVMASASIPVFVKSVKHDGKILYDGGIRDHSIAYTIMSEKDLKITECLSIFSRPKDISLDNSWKDESILSVLERTVEVMNIEISKTDEQLQKTYCEQKGIKLHQAFMPIVTKSTYDVNKERLQVLSAKAIEEVMKLEI